MQICRRTECSFADTPFYVQGYFTTEMRAAMLHECFIDKHLRQADRTLRPERLLALHNTSSSSSGPTVVSKFISIHTKRIVNINDNTRTPVFELQGRLKQYKEGKINKTGKSMFLRPIFHEKTLFSLYLHEFCSDSKKI
jgi:hypothetical protein